MSLDNVQIFSITLGLPYTFNLITGHPKVLKLIIYNSIITQLPFNARGFLVEFAAGVISNLEYNKIAIFYYINFYYKTIYVLDLLLINSDKV